MRWDFICLHCCHVNLRWWRMDYIEIIDSNRILLVILLNICTHSQIWLVWLHGYDSNVILKLQHVVNSWMLWYPKEAAYLIGDYSSNKNIVILFVFFNCSHMYTIYLNHFHPKFLPLSGDRTQTNIWRQLKFGFTFLIWSIWFSRERLLPHNLVICWPLVQSLNSSKCGKRKLTPKTSSVSSICTPIQTYICMHRCRHPHILILNFKMSKLVKKIQIWAHFIYFFIFCWWFKHYLHSSC